MRKQNFTKAKTHQTLFLLAKIQRLVYILLAT